MALIVEDGTGVSGANTYVTLAEFKAWADERGITYDNDAKVTEHIYRAMDFIERQNFQGRKANETQALQFPRTDVMIDGYYIDANEIPKELKIAEYEQINIEHLGYSDLASVDRRTTSETIGSISVTYASNSSSKTDTPALTLALKKLILSKQEVTRS
jgi:hypothetical protein|tara:strand:- start:458 stop:931 length:474 start_codon:yes stop_codon:yes gene_type:complete